MSDVDLVNARTVIYRLWVALGLNPDAYAEFYETQGWSDTLAFVESHIVKLAYFQAKTLA